MAKSKILNDDTLPQIDFTVYDNASNPNNHVTPFYGLASDSEVGHSPIVSELQNTAKELVQSGLITEEQLQGVDLRVVTYNSNTPEELEPKEALLKVSQLENHPLVAFEVSNDISLSNSSSFMAFNRSEGGFINVNVPEISTVRGASDNEGRDIKSTFLHELGHATLSPEVLKSQVKEVLMENQSFDSIEDASRLIAAVSLSCEGKDLDTVIGEMYADTFSGLSLLALEGPESAMEAIDKRLDARLDELNVSMSANQLSPFYSDKSSVVTHHTTEALLLLREGIQNGEASAALESGLGEAYAVELTAQGYFKEYENTRFADMNVHHLDGDSLKPGAPAGISKEALLMADALSSEPFSGNGMQCTGGKGMTVMLESVTYEAVKAERFDVGGESIVGEKTLIVDDSFKMLSVNSTTLNFFEEGYNNPTVSLEGQTMAKTYLLEHFDQITAANEMGVAESAVERYNLNPYEPEIDSDSKAMHRDLDVKDIELQAEESAMEM